MNGVGILDTASRRGKATSILRAEWTDGIVWERPNLAIRLPRCVSESPPFDMGFLKDRSRGLILRVLDLVDHLQVTPQRH